MYFESSRKIDGCVFIRSNSAFCHLAIFTWCLARWLCRRLTPGLGVCNFSYVQWHLCRACFARAARRAIAVPRSPCGVWEGDSGLPPPIEGGCPFRCSTLTLDSMRPSDCAPQSRLDAPAAAALLHCLPCSVVDVFHS